MSVCSTALSWPSSPARAAWARRPSPWRRRWPPRATGGAVVCEVGRAGARRAALRRATRRAPGREVELEEGLWATTIDPVVALEEWAGRQIGSRRLVGLLTHSNAFAAFVNAAPGARELVAITKAWELGQRERWVKGTRRLRPRGPRRPGERPRRRHAAHPAHVRRDRARRADRHRRRARSSALLEDPARSAVVAVALPAELSVSETLDLEERVAGAVGRPLDAVVVNGVLPRRFSAAEVDRLLARDGAVPGPMAAAARRQHGQASTQQGQLRRLRRHASAHVTTLPYVAAPHLGLAEVRGAGRRAGAAALAPPARRAGSATAGAPAARLERRARPRSRGRSPSARAARRSVRSVLAPRLLSIVPSQQPRKPIGIVTRPGNVSDDGEPCESGPGHTGGLSTIMTTEAMMPNGDAGQRARGVEAPPVQRQQQRREVRARREHERHAHEHGDVEAGADRAACRGSRRRRRRSRRCAPPLRSSSSVPRPSTFVHRSCAIAPADGDARARRRPRGSSRTRRRENSASAMSPPVGALAAAQALRQQRRGQVAALADGLRARRRRGSRGRRSR